MSRTSTIIMCLRTIQENGKHPTEYKMLHSSKSLCLKCRVIIFNNNYRDLAMTSGIQKTMYSNNIANIEKNKTISIMTLDIQKSIMCTSIQTLPQVPAQSCLLSSLYCPYNYNLLHFCKATLEVRLKLSCNQVILLQNCRFCPFFLKSFICGFLAQGCSTAKLIGPAVKVQSSYVTRKVYTYVFDSVHQLHVCAYSCTVAAAGPC